MKIPIDQKYNEINLKELLPLFEELEYFVFFGTLLGLIRENELLEYDDDIDFLINEKHLIYVIELFYNRYDKSESSLKIPIHPVNQHKHFKQATSIRDNVRTFVDMSFYEKNDEEKTIIDFNSYNNSPQYEENHFSMSQDLIYPIQKRYFQKYGYVKVPAQPIKCLEILYGNNWMIPYPKKHYDEVLVNGKPKLIYHEC